MKILKNVLVLLVLACFIVSCEQDTPLPETNEPNAVVFEGPAESSETSKGAVQVVEKAACGGFYSGSYSVINSYYNYPSKSVDVSCASNGATVSVSYTALDIPNKFTIRDPNGVIVQSTSWLGNASYPGPWGSSLSNSGSANLSFTKNFGTYTLYVETLTPPNYSYSPNSDYWSVSVSCTCSGGGGGTPCNDDCGDFYSGNYYTINSYYTYPDKTMDVHCVDNGKTITISVTALDIPNRFTVKTSSGTTVTYTGWLGNANYPGPWGMSLSNSGTATMTFSKSQSTYKLRVETLTPPNYSYSPTTDHWDASLSCAQ